MDDTKILEKIEQAKELYEDGAILEMRDLLSEIIDDIDEFSNVWEED